MIELVGLEMQRKMLMSAVKTRKPALLVGPTGAAKTSLAKQVALKVNPRGYVRLNMNGGTTPDKLEGRFTLAEGRTTFQYGVVVQAMREGKTLIVDEMNATPADTMFTMHPVLEEVPRILVPDTGEEFGAAEGFSVIATMNPSAGYAGTKELNAALMSRFVAVIHFPTPRGEQLLAICKAHFPDAPTGVTTRVVEVTDKLLEMRQQEQIMTPVGVREMLHAVELACDGLSLQEAVVAAIGNKLEVEERAAARNLRLLADEDVAKVRNVGELLEAAERAQMLEKRVEALEGKLKQYAAIAKAVEAGQKESIEEARKEASGT